MTPREIKIIDLLVKIARPKILKHFRTDSCIASTRIAIDVLAHYHIAAAPRPCRVFVSTPKLWERISTDTFEKPFRPGEWSIGIGYPGAPLPPGHERGFLGHMVALIEDGPNDILVDLSLDQASRPKRGFVLEPASIRLPREWRKEKLSIRTPSFILLYELIENDVYLTSKDWLNPDRTHRIVANVISLIDKKIANQSLQS